MKDSFLLIITCYMGGTLAAPDSFRGSCQENKQINKQQQQKQQK